MAIESASNVFNFLATTRNTAAVDCLAGLLKSPDTQIAWQAAAAITARTEHQALESFLEAFKSDAESIKYRHWKPLGYRLRPIIGKVLEGQLASSLSASVGCDCRMRVGRAIYFGCSRG